MNDPIYKKFKEYGIIQEGHFKLSSGLHSDTYFQMSKLTQDPNIIKHLTSYFIFLHDLRQKQIQTVIGLAMGSVFFAYELASQLNCNFVFFEREGNKMQLRRGQTFDKEKKIYLVEDVITTGSSLKEVIPQVRKEISWTENDSCYQRICMGSNIQGIGTFIDRRSKEHKDSLNPHKVHSLLTLDVNTYTEENLPNELKTMKILKPGSRQI